SKIKDSSNIFYRNAADWDYGDNKPPTLNEIKYEVFEKNKRYLVDFSYIEDNAQYTDAKNAFKNEISVSFDCDLLIVSEHKGELIFVPIDSDIDMGYLKSPFLQKNRRSKRSESSDELLPHLSFYLVVNRPITEEECTFSNSNLWNKGKRNFCDEPHISLVYHVVLERSLQFGVIGSATPDAKIVRIFLDDDSTGAGIHLNNSLNYIRTVKSGVLDGYFQNWSTDVIAQDYKVNITADNKKSTLLKTFPSENINSSYGLTQIESFTLGVSTGAETDKEGPKVKLEANGSYTQSNRLSFKTKDYQIIRSTTSPQSVSFTWQREQYSTVESLLNRTTDLVWAVQYPVDIKKISPISYASFLPKMDVIFMSDPNETGSTTYAIDTSVNISPLYHGAYKHYYVIGSHQSYHGFEDASKRRRISKKTRFTVNWDHPVFSGGRPVNLQLGSFNKSCVEVGIDHSLS
ncbi:hemolysin, partial [Vibrio agarivorans]